LRLFGTFISKYFELMLTLFGKFKRCFFSVVVSGCCTSWKIHHFFLLSGSIEEEDLQDNSFALTGVN